MILAPQVPVKRYSIAEYFDLEAKSEEKLEFHNGKIIEMAGASYNHNKIVANIIIELGKALDERDECSVLPSDIKIHIPRIRQFVYPDAVVICEEPIFYEKRNDTILNPLLIVEVSSGSTEDYDRQGKFFKYRMIPSFKEYVLIAQDESFVSSFYHQDEKTWIEENVEDVEKTIHFPSLNIDIALKKIYKGVKF
jgi:Uma2 family endonuclease